MVPSLFCSVWFIRSPLVSLFSVSPECLCLYNVSLVSCCPSLCFIPSYFPSPSFLFSLSLAPSRLPLLHTLIVSRQCALFCVCYSPVSLWLFMSAVLPMCSHFPHDPSVYLCPHLPQFRVLIAL